MKYRLDDKTLERLDNRHGLSYLQKKTKKTYADYWVKRINEIFGVKWEARRDNKIRKIIIEVNKIR